MEKEYLLRRIEMNFSELGLLTDYLRDRSVETLAVVEDVSRTLSKIKKRCSALPYWALGIFQQTLEDHALRAMLMAGNTLLLQERRSIIENMEKEVERIEKKLEEYHKRKENIISIVNVLKTFNLPSDALGSQLKNLASSENEMKMKKYGSFSHAEKEIESLLDKSDGIFKKAEEEKRTLLTRERIETISQIQEYQDMIGLLEALGVTAEPEKERIENHKKELLGSEYQKWSQIFYNLQKDTETLKNRTALAEELQSYFKELEHAGMGTPLSEVRTLYKTGNLLVAEHRLKAIKVDYERMKEKIEGRKKIAEGILLQCEEMLGQLPSGSNEDFKTRYERFQNTLESDQISSDLLDEIQNFKIEIENYFSKLKEKEMKENELNKIALELKENILKLKNNLRKSVDIFVNIGCKKKYIVRFQNEIETMEDEITAVFAEVSASKELPQDGFRSLSNRLRHIDVRIEDAQRSIASYVDICNSFVRYKELYMKFMALPQGDKKEPEKEFQEVKEFLTEHVMDFDFPIEELVEWLRRAEIDLKEREIILGESARKVEKMKNELLARKSDFALMGYSREEEHLEEKIQEIFERNDLSNEEAIDKMEKQKEELEYYMREQLSKNIGEEIKILEKIKMEGRIERYVPFVEDIIEITEKYNLSDLNMRAGKLLGRIEVVVRRCPYIDCGEEIEGIVQFCPSCGRKIVICPVCSKYNKLESKFCTGCGRLLKVDEYIMERLEKEDSVSYQNLVEVGIEEEVARQAIQAVFDNCSSAGGKIFGNTVEMNDYCIIVVRTTCEEKIWELLPIHGAISADDLENCSPEDIVRFYEKYKDNARDELGYEIELIEDMIVKKT